MFMCLFCVLSQEMKHINFFLGAQNGGFWAGAKKFMLKKFMWFFRPLFMCSIYIELLWAKLCMIDLFPSWLLPLTLWKPLQSPPCLRKLCKYWQCNYTWCIALLRPSWSPSLQQRLSWTYIGCSRSRSSRKGVLGGTCLVFLFASKTKKERPKEQKTPHFAKVVGLASKWPPAVESSIAVEDAVENRRLYRVFVSRLFERVLDTIAPLSRGWAPKRFRTRRLRTSRQNAFSEMPFFRTL